MGTLLTLVGGFDVLEAFLNFLLKDVSCKLASFDGQKVIEVVDSATVGGVSGDLVAVIEYGIETCVKKCPNIGRRRRRGGWHRDLRVKTA